MEAVKILEKTERVDWDYDEEADVLYLSLGKPRKALGVDIGDGIVVRYDKKKEVVGLTVLGMRAKLLESLKRTQDWGKGMYSRGWPSSCIRPSE